MQETTTESRIEYIAPTVRSWRDEGHFLIRGVSYRGQVVDYALFEKMTPAMSQDKLSELYEKEKEKGNPTPTDMPLIWKIATRGYELKEENSKNSERLRNFFRAGFRKYPNTLTRIIYNESEEDKIVHNYRTSDEYSTRDQVTGPDDLIENLTDIKLLSRLIEMENPRKINETSQWINSTNSHIWRLNSTPNQTTARVAGFDVDGDWLGLVCDWDPLGECPAFRVLRID